MAEGYEPQPLGLVTETVTKGSDDYVTSIDIVAKKFGKIVSCSGYALLKAGNFSNQTPIATVSSLPTNNIYFYSDKGDIMRVTGSGNIIFHNAVTFASAAYRFFNFTYPCD